jgi:hypothetical protein
MNNRKVNNSRQIQQLPRCIEQILLEKQITVSENWLFLLFFDHILWDG